MLINISVKYETWRLQSSALAGWGWMVSCDTKAVADWLVDGARSAAEPHQVLAELCDRLVGCGIALWRVAVFVRTLHPEVMGRRFLWRPGGDGSVTGAPHDLIGTAGFPGRPGGPGHG